MNLVVQHRYLSKHKQNNKETKRNFFVEIVFFDKWFILSFGSTRDRVPPNIFYICKKLNLQSPSIKEAAEGGRILTDTTLKHCNVDTSNVRRKKIAWSFGCYAIYTILAHWDLNQLPLQNFYLPAGIMECK